MAWLLHRMTQFMDEQEPIPAEPPRSAGTEPETPTGPRGISPDAGGAKPRRTTWPRQPRQAKAEPQRVEIVLRVAPVEPQPGEPPKPGSTGYQPVLSGDSPGGTNEPSQSESNAVSDARPPAIPVGGSPTSTGEAPAPPGAPAAPSQFANRTSQRGDNPIPARMLNEFVYCQRLFYYEFVEGVFVESADTLRGEALHQRVDTGTGALPAARSSRRKEAQTCKPEYNPKSKTDQSLVTSAATGGPDQEIANQKSEIENEMIHSRSVRMGSERLGVVAKMDLVEVRAARATNAAPANDLGEQDLFAALEVCPVDYKAGAPREGEDANELWDTDKMQLGLQALILRENGYTCNEGIIFYRTTKQRVRLRITPELESWILQNIAEARRVIAGPIPAPLVHSPKCVRCSLAPVCLPDETRMLANVGQASSLPVPGASPPRVQPGESTTDGRLPSEPAGRLPALQTPRRLIAARDDTRPLYLNTPGYRVGCSDEVLQIKEKDVGPRGSRLVEEVRLRDLSHVALFGNIQISTQAIQSLCEREIPVTYFSMGGWFYGITRGHTLKNVFLRMEQFRLARDPAMCLSLARQFVHGKIRNHRTMLMRNHLEPPEPTVLKLRRASEDALAAGSLDELLGVEGAAASLYFQQFSGMIKVADDLMEKSEGPSPKSGIPVQLRFNFNFSHRNRRPPTDPVNAMLSLAYSLLTKDCVLAALAVGFDPYIGFYHQPRFGRPALGLDLVEEFRPLIAESAVLSCLNNRVIGDRDFVRAGQAVNLTAAGRKRFFQVYEQRMSSLITHPLFDYKVSYRRALELQARLLAKALTGEIAEYLPLLTR
jgi:CRISPR-associated protein Cas1